MWTDLRKLQSCQRLRIANSDHGIVCLQYDHSFIEMYLCGCVIWQNGKSLPTNSQPTRDHIIHVWNRNLYYTQGSSMSGTVLYYF